MFDACSLYTSHAVPSVRVLSIRRKYQEQGHWSLCFASNGFDGFQSQGYKDARINESRCELGDTTLNCTYTWAVQWEDRGLEVGHKDASVRRRLEIRKKTANRDPRRLA